MQEVTEMDKWLEQWLDETMEKFNLDKEE